jgi:hypothetical protein
MWERASCGCSTDERESGILIDDRRYEFSARTADTTVSVGGSNVEAVAGYEWARAGGDSFQSRLFGARLSLADGERGTGPYMLLLGRSVDGSSARRAWFDGFDIGVGSLTPVSGSWLCDACCCWSFVDGDAIRAGRDSISELRLSFGLRFGF